MLAEGFGRDPSRDKCCDILETKLYCTRETMCELWAQCQIPAKFVQNSCEIRAKFTFV